MKKIILFAAAVVLLTPVLYSESYDYDYDYLIPEHEEKDWEQVSLEVLGHEIEHHAKEMGLHEFQVEVKESGISIIYRDLLFPPDSPSITDETQNKINRLALVIERFSNKIVLVQGHSAKIAGQEDDGTELSSNRAHAVLDELVGTGLFEENRMKAYGYGEHRPVADNSTEEGRILNRRVEIAITDHFADDAEYTGSDPAVWWRTLSDVEDPGYMVFLFDDEKTSAAEITTILLENGYPYARAYDTEEGVALVYPDVTYEGNSAYPDDWSIESLDFLVERLPIDDSTQVRIGGRGGILAEEGTAQARYNTAYYMASSTGILPGNTLVGDEPYTYSFGNKCMSADFAYNRWVDALEFNIVETNPLSRYREFSTLGIGAGFGLRFSIPPFQLIPGLAPIRIGLGANGLYHIQDATSSVESLWEGEWGLDLGYRMPVSDFFAFTPMIGYGGTVHILTDTTESGIRQVGEVFYSQTAAFKTDFEFAPEKWILDGRTQVAIYLQPYYRVFFDQEYLGHSVNAEIGVRFDF